jgi:hypothetical protein
MNVNIKDNLLPEDTFSRIANTIMSSEFPWFFCPAVSMDEQAILSDYQFVHPVYRLDQAESNYFPLLRPLFGAINAFSVLSCKINCNPYAGDTIREHGMHQDIRDLPNGLRVNTAVFYLNTNNGYTLVKSTNEKIESVANRLVWFDSEEYHTGSTTTDQKARYVININYFPAKEKE